MKRYPDYWEKGPDGQSKPYLDEIKMVWITDTGTSVAAFIARQLSSTGIGNPETRNQVLSARKDVQVIESEPNTCWNHIGFNTKRKPFDDVRVRKAITLTIDTVEIGKAQLGDFNGKPVWRYSAPLPWVFPEALTQEEMAKHPLWESPRSQKTIDEAKKLMADAGYADGFSAEFISITGGIADAMQLYINQINKVFPNIKFRANPLDNAIQLERTAKGDFDIRAYCYIHEPTAVAHLKTVYHSKGGRNVAQLSDPTMDAILDKAGLELDPEKRKQLLREAQFRALETVPFWPTYHNVTYTAFQPEARGVRLGAATNGLQMYAKEVWLDR
jgi:peptide/nickel transport system substrate-binding protein